MMLNIILVIVVTLNVIMLIDVMVAASSQFTPHIVHLSTVLTQSHIIIDLIKYFLSVLIPSNFKSTFDSQILRRLI
jgi:hypothetical protein